MYISGGSAQRGRAELKLLYFSFIKKLNWDLGLEDLLNIFWNVEKTVDRNIQRYFTAAPETSLIWNTTLGFVVYYSEYCNIGFVEYGMMCRQTRRGLNPAIKPKL